VILFELALEAGQQRERVARGARKTRQNLIVIKTSDFFRAGLHDSFAERYLTVSSERNVSVFPYKKDSSATHPIVFFPHV
jgi:microcystin degradation protein MlrC